MRPLREKFMKSIYDYKVDDSQKNPVSLSDYKGKTLLIVNVASRCGLTPQYKGLQELYSKYSNKDFEILAFPCNQFGAQEPGSNEEIKEFCDINFNVSFKIFDKINVNGSSASPLFKHLSKGQLGRMALGAKTMLLTQRVEKILKIRLGLKLKLKAWAC